MKNGHYFNEYQEEVWVQDGKYHRLDGPAKIWRDGAQHWFQNGIHHREGGPAIISKNGGQFWYKNGKLHREDGPAIIWSGGAKYYYLNDKEFKNEVLLRLEVQRLKRKEKLKTIKERNARK